MIVWYRLVRWCILQIQVCKTRAINLLRDKFFMAKGFIMIICFLIFLSICNHCTQKWCLFGDIFIYRLSAVSPIHKHQNYQLYNWIFSNISPIWQTILMLQLSFMDVLELWFFKHFCVISLWSIVCLSLQFQLTLLVNIHYFLLDMSLLSQVSCWYTYILLLN